MNNNISWSRLSRKLRFKSEDEIIAVLSDLQLPERPYRSKNFNSHWSEKEKDIWSWIGTLQKLHDAWIKALSGDHIVDANKKENDVKEYHELQKLVMEWFWKSPNEEVLDNLIRSYLEDGVRSIWAMHLATGATFDDFKRCFGLDSKEEVKWCECNRSTNEICWACNKPRKEFCQTAPRPESEPKTFEELNPHICQKPSEPDVEEIKKQIRQLVIEDVPYKYQSRLLEILK